MLSTQYRLRLEKSANLLLKERSRFDRDDIGTQKLAQKHTTAATWMRQARQKAANPDIRDGSTDDFLNKMGLGEPDPSDQRTGFDSADDIGDWFNRKKPDDWRQRD